MTDRTSARIFGEIFYLLDKKANEYMAIVGFEFFIDIAKEINDMTKEYDFS